MKKRSAKPQKSTAKNHKTTLGQIRIIAGKHRGRKLPVLSLEGLRPTTDRVKETVFNWLMPYIDDRTVIDCFAGAGSLGFEAASRGAKHTTFIELHPQAAKQLKQNVQLLQLSNSQVMQVDCLAYLKQLSSDIYFDLAFVDPPFRQQLVSPCCALLDPHIADQGLIYIELEHEVSQLELPANWHCLKQKDAGQVSYRLYQKQL